MNSALDNKISCQLTAQSPQKLTQGTWINYQVTNHSNQAIQLLPWYTPLEGFLTKLFVITDSQGNAQDYQGPMVKRAQPLDEDYITLAPGESLTAKLNLLQAYNLTAGQYQISMVTKYHQAIIAQQVHHIALCKNSQLMINIID